MDSPHASMRPGQAAPDEHVPHRVWATAVTASMRPGQAAPDEPVAGADVATPATASMRPGQAAPDESEVIQWQQHPTSCFNEAGASSPG